MLEALKEGNLDKASQYVNFNEILETETIEEMNAEEIENLLFNGIEYQVKNVSKNGKEAIVEVEITNKNFETILANYMTKAFQYSLNNAINQTEEIGEEELNAQLTQFLKEELENDSIEKVTNTTTLTVNKEGVKWKVVVDDNLKKSLLPRFFETMEKIQDLS